MKEYTFDRDWITYVPEYDGNRLENDPVTVEIKALTVGEQRAMSKGVIAKRTKGGGFQTNAAENNMRLVRSHVRNIRNLRVNGADITTIEELEDTPLTELLGEIEEAVTDISVLNEGDIKNFKPQSDGSAGRTSGTAATVTNQDSN
ncbi:MAG: hypothetical protein AVO39_10260 [delta proteobacterium MLS_D]|nr:MAG: hypothetical protein AVO39_10260 [delta proteobacterium MLS_D]